MTKRLVKAGDLVGGRFKVSGALLGEGSFSEVRSQSSPKCAHLTRGSGANSNCLRARVGIPSRRHPDRRPGANRSSGLRSPSAPRGTVNLLR